MTPEETKNLLNDRIRMLTVLMAHESDPSKKRLYNESINEIKLLL